MITAEILKNEQAINEVLGFHYEMEYPKPPYAEAGRNWAVDEAVKRLDKEL